MISVGIINKNTKGYSYNVFHVTSKSNSIYKDKQIILKIT